MSDAEILDLFRIVFLVGVATGAAIAFVVERAWRERPRNYVPPRCEREVECVLGLNHGGPCLLEEYD